MEALEIVKEAIKDRINIDTINYDDKLDELGLDSLDLVVGDDFIMFSNVTKEGKDEVLRKIEITM